MKIVVLDGFTLNPGDLSWDPLLELGDCDLYERTLPHQVVERAAGAEIILTNKVILGAEHFSQLPQLRYIGVMATGTNVIDLDAAAAHDISVANVPAYSTKSVAQQVFALLLEITQQVGYHNERVHTGAWCKSQDFTFRERPLIELDGLTMGIVGYGRIGQAVARIAHSFGMNVVVYARQAYRFKELLSADGPVVVELDGLFAMADVVSLHCPLTQETANLVNARRLTMMKPGAILLNSARGGLIDEAALAQALTRGSIAGAGLDVLSSEPPRADNPLLSAPNCIIAPHLGWATKAARQRLLAVLVANIQGYVDGTPQNLVTV
jgi:glycerate dehydrogenase